MRSDDDIGEFFGSVIAGVVGLAFAASLLLIAYGMAALVLRYAFGTELPNPFELLPAEWRQKFPFLVPPLPPHSK